MRQAKQPSSETRRLAALSFDWTKAYRAAEAGVATETIDDLTSAIVLTTGEIRKSTAIDVACLLRALNLLGSPDSLRYQYALQLALSLLAPDVVRPSDVAKSLAHPSSSVRLWMFQHAWVVRHRLSPVDYDEPLLGNVSNTLGYWELSLALCRAIHRSDAAFWQATAAYHPTEMSEQYERRIAAAKGQEGWERAAALVQHERRVRQFLAEWQARAIAPPASQAVH